MKPARSAFADARPRDLDGVGMSQRDIARLWGCSQQYVYQLEMRALQKLRVAMARQRLTYESLAPREDIRG